MVWAMITTTKQRSSVGLCPVREEAWSCSGIGVDSSWRWVSMATERRDLAGDVRQWAFADPQV
jgi:hypothetical protein